MYWQNLREEPLVFINGNPFVVREADQPFCNLEYTGAWPPGYCIIRVCIRADGWVGSSACSLHVHTGTRVCGWTVGAHYESGGCVTRGGQEVYVGWVAVTSWLRAFRRPRGGLSVRAAPGLPMWRYNCCTATVRLVVPLHNLPPQASTAAVWRIWSAG